MILPTYSSWYDEIGYRIAEVYQEELDNGTVTLPLQEHLNNLYSEVEKEALKEVTNENRR